MNYDLFSVKFSVNFVGMYRKDNVLTLVLLVFEMLRIPSAKVDAHFPKKLSFVANKGLAQDAFGKYPRAIKNLSKYTVANSYEHKFSYYLVYSTKLP